MRILFMGTPPLSAKIFEALAEKHDIAGVFTRPDAVRGRGKKLVASAVKEAAHKRGIEVFTPATLKDPQAVELISALHPDVICVAAYGAILPAAILVVPPLGCLNVHTSLLPRWRGAAPIERAILAGDEQTGVCIMRMEEGLDTGPVCRRETVSIGRKYRDELEIELASIGAHALLAALDDNAAGTASWINQPAGGITYAHKIEKGELNCDPGDSAKLFEAKVRASSASHPARIEMAGRRLAVERARVVEGDMQADLIGWLSSGEAAIAEKRLVVGVSDGAVEIERVKPDGKKGMTGRQFAAGIQGIKNTKVAWGRA